MWGEAQINGRWDELVKKKEQRLQQIGCDCRSSLTVAVVAAAAVQNRQRGGGGSLLGVMPGLRIDASSEAGWSEGDSSTVRGDAVIIFIMPARDRWAAYSIGDRGGGKRGSWCKLRVSKMEKK